MKFSYTTSFKRFTCKEAHAIIFEAIYCLTFPPITFEIDKALFSSRVPIINLLSRLKVWLYLLYSQNRNVSICFGFVEEWRVRYICKLFKKMEIWYSAWDRLQKEVKQVDKKEKMNDVLFSNAEFFVFD